MHELLCVLLHLFLVISPNEYYDTDIFQIESINQTAVDAVENDVILYNSVIQTHSPDASLIVIWNTDEQN